MLNEGSEGLKQYGDQRDRLSRGLGNDDVERIAAANDAIGDLSIRVGGAADQFILGMSPAIMSTMDLLLQLGDTADGTRSRFETMGKDFGETTLLMATGFADVGRMMIDPLSGFEPKSTNAALKEIEESQKQLERLQIERDSKKGFTDQFKKADDKQATMDKVEADLKKRMEINKAQQLQAEMQAKAGKDAEGAAERLGLLKEQELRQEAELRGMKLARAEIDRMAADEAQRANKKATDAADRTREALEREIATLEGMKDAYTVSELRDMKVG